MLTWPGGGGINVGGGVNVVVVGSGAEVKRLDGMDGLATAAPLLKKRRKTRRYMINTVTWMHSLLIGSSRGLLPRELPLKIQYTLQ